MSMQEIIDSAKTLPPAERIHVVDELLRSLNPKEVTIDEAWADECERRLEHVRTGKSIPIPGEVVFARIQERFGQS